MGMRISGELANEFELVILRKFFGMLETFLSVAVVFDGTGHAHGLQLLNASRHRENIRADGAGLGAAIFTMRVLLCS